MFEDKQWFTPDFFFQAIEHSDFLKRGTPMESDATTEVDNRINTGRILREIIGQSWRMIGGRLPMVNLWWILVAIANWLQVQRKVWAKANVTCTPVLPHVAILGETVSHSEPAFKIHFVIQIFTAMWTMRVADTSWHSQFWLLVWLERCFFCPTEKDVKFLHLLCSSE